MPLHLHAHRMPKTLLAPSANRTLKRGEARAPLVAVRIRVQLSLKLRVFAPWLFKSPSPATFLSYWCSP